MSTVHFVDTTVLAELLNIPGLSKQHSAVNAEYLQLEENGDTFVLPIAVLIETGNHIAHVPKNMRYPVADTFVSLVKKAVEGKCSWSIIPEIPFDMLERILAQFPAQAAAATSFADVSIVEQFNEYWEKRQPIGEMRIWSFDKHLSGYIQTGGLSRRKNK